MAIAKHKCDICDREVKPEELIACDECYHKIEREHSWFEKLFTKISLLIDSNIMARFPLKIFPFPRMVDDAIPKMVDDAMKELKDENPSP